MNGFITNIEEKTLANSFFRQVIHTSQHMQLVLMALKPNEDIGMEVHEIVDQFLRVEKGNGKVILNGEEHLVKDGDVIIVPAGTSHNLINTSATDELKLYTIYAPPHHKDETVHQTKADAEADKEDHL